jgi:hypothetical protein
VHYRLLFNMRRAHADAIADTGSCPVIPPLIIVLLFICL